MTLGELRRLTKNLGDDVEIISSSDNYELAGAWVNAASPRLVKVKKERRTFRDDFSGSSYSKDVFIPDENGNTVLKI